jgi:hypothetical protein
MAQHKFLLGMYENGVVVGARCVRCGVMTLYVDGKIPDDIREQHCQYEESAKPLPGS